MMAFRADPEDPARILAASQRPDEIGIVERELAVMQRDLVSMLQQKTRLAALGLAVSKINHDLRNLLASAQLFSDRLARLPDPQVQRFAPKLMRALERAIDFCQSTISYGRAQEATPDRRPVPLSELVEEVRDTLGLQPDLPIGWITAIERGLAVDADRDQLLRVLVNLCRNAMQALEARSPNNSSRDQIRISGRREGAVVVIEVADTGPGLNERARAHLFEAFQGSTRTGGAGLGPCDCGRTGRRPWRRTQPGRGHDRGDVPAENPGSADLLASPPRRAGARLKARPGQKGTCGTEASQAASRPIF